jgi:hypothetical protein
MDRRRIAGNSILPKLIHIYINEDNYYYHLPAVSKISTLIVLSSIVNSR